MTPPGSRYSVRLGRPAKREQKLRTIIAAFSIATLLLSDGSTVAQPASNPKSGADRVAQEGRGSGLQKKTASCRKEGLEKRLSEQDLRDHVVVCVQEARLACLKQAIEQKIRGQERVKFLDRRMADQPI